MRREDISPVASPRTAERYCPSCGTTTEHRNDRCWGCGTTNWDEEPPKYVGNRAKDPTRHREQ